MLLALFTIPRPSAARENLLSGSLALRQEYDSNIYLNDTDPQESWYTILSPRFLIISRSQTGQLKANYDLAFKKNLTTGEKTLDYDVLLQGDTNFSSTWQAGVSDGFHLSDDPIYADQLIPEADLGLSARRQRERFWINSASLHTDYQYAKNSTLTLGYNNRILVSENEQRGDYIRHNPYLAVGYQLNHQWRTEWGYNYTRGEFQQEDDLETHSSSLRMIDQATPHDQLSAGYSFTQTRYLGPTPGYRLHNLNGGWLRKLSQLTTLNLSAGLTLVDWQNRDDQKIANYSVELTRQLHRGQVTIGGQGGADQMQFDGNQDGLSKYWQVQGASQYQLKKRLLANLAFSIRNNDYIDQPGASQERIYQANCGLSYPFFHWYEVALNYLYRKSDGDAQDDRYQDHRLFLELKVAKDLLKW